jgi:DNA-binding transcriptional ArsR family regulator
MHLTQPLRSLIPTLDGAALTVLARTESALSASQIARLTQHGSRTGLRLALDRLVGTGLVDADPSSSGRLYRLNRQHVLAPAVLAGASARNDLLSRLTDGLSALVPAPEHASVFGSLARDVADENSDIDLLLVMPAGLDLHDESWRAQVRALEDAVLRWTGNRLEPLVLTTSQLTAAARRGERIIDELSSDASTLVGESFESLLVRLAAVAGR